MDVLEKLRRNREDKGIKPYEPKTKTYTPAKQTTKAAEKSAPSLRSQGMAVDVVGDTGLMKTALPKASLPKVKINTDAGRTKQNSTVNPMWGFQQNDMTKSTAQDEKTRLYETNDKHLSKDEIIRKYSYVAEDQELDYETLRKAVNKGQKEVGRAYSEMLKGTAGVDMETYNQVAQLQAALQGRLKSASFTAGMLESLGGDVTDIIAKASGNEQLQEQNEKLKAQLAQTRANNSGYGTVGALTGELAKAGAMYTTIGAAAEKATAKGLSALQGQMLKSTSSDLLQKAAARAALNPKATGIAAKMIGQQAADTAVNIPMNILAGTAQGKTAEEISRDIGKQAALDALLNVGMGAAGAGARALKDASKKGPILGIDFEKIKYDHAPVDEDLIAFKKGIDDGTVGKWQSYDLKPPTEKAVKEVSDLVGFDINGYGTSVNPDGFVHIENRHGVKGEHDTSMADINDLGKIQYILDNYDNVSLLNQRTRAFRNTDHTTAKMVIFEKRINGTYYVVEAVPDTKKKKLQVITAYKSKKREGYQMPDANKPPAYGRTVSELPSNNSISQTAETVNDIAHISKASGSEASANPVQNEKISDVAATMVQNRNVLAKRLTKEERQALELEYNQLKNAEYRSEQLKKISEETGGDPAAIREASRGFEDRMQEITKTLAAQEGLRTEDSIRRDVADEIINIFGLRGKKNKQRVNDSLLRVMTEAKNGEISRETREALFERLFHISDKSRVSTAGLKSRLQNKRLLLDVEAAADIADINEWNLKMKGLLGKIKIGRESNIQPFYGELRKDFPTYFPEAIDDPAQQLQRIRQVAEKIADGHGLEKADFQADFDRALDRLVETMGVKGAYGEQVREGLEGFKSNLLGRTDYGSVTMIEVMDWHDERRRLQELVEQAQVELSKSEQQVLEGMLNGDFTEVMAKEMTGPRYGLLKQQYNIRKPLRDIEEQITGYKQYQAANRHKMAAEVVGEVRMAEGGKRGWKDKAMGILYGRETQERNLLDIAPDKETAKRIIRAYFDPIHENERKRVLMINGLKDRIRTLKISTKNNISIELPGTGKAKTSESALVQWLGENRYALAQMKESGAPMASYSELEQTIRRIESSLQPEQLQRINAGVETLRSIYEELHPLINEVLIRNGYDPIGYIPGYFPHMNFDDPSNMIESAARKLGFDFASKELPMDIAGRTADFRPGKKWSGNLLTRTGEKTDYDALRAFDLYIDNISDVIYHTDDIRNLRSYEDYLRYSLSDEGLRADIDKIHARKDLLPEAKQEELDKLYKEKMSDHKLQNYVTHVRLYTDLLAGKKHSSDRELESGLGRKVYKVLNEIENRVAGNMVAGNVGSALTNFIPITQGMSGMGLKSNLQGLKESLINMSRTEMDELTKKSAFLTTRKGTDKLYMTGLQQIEKAGGKLNPLSWMEAADQFSTQAVWRSKYYDNMAKGLAEDTAIKNADEYCRNLFAGRSKGAMPTAFQTKKWKLLTMFQLEVNNQLSFLFKDIPREAQGDMRKAFQTYTGIVIGAYIYNDVYEKLTGRRSALDPFGIANEAFGDLTGEQVRNVVDIAGDALSGEELQLTEKKEKKKASQVLTDTMADIGGNVPFVGGIMFDGGRIPLQSALPSAKTIVGAAADIKTGDMTAEKGRQTIGKELLKPAAYLIPPFAGGQMKKTIQGLDTMRKGGSYSQSNEGPELQFAADNESAGQWLKAGIFGKWATDGGKKYIENGNQPMSAKRTATYEALVAAGVKNTVAFEEIGKISMESKDQNKRSVIRSSSLNEDQKAILFYDMVASDTDKEILDWFDGKTTRSKAADCLLRMADHEKAVAQRMVLQSSDLSGSAKEYIYLNKISDSKNDQERITMLKNNGLGMNEFLKIRSKFGTLDESSMKTTAKKDSFIDWLNEQPYSRAMRYEILEYFKFGGGFVSDYSKKQLARVK